MKFTSNTLIVELQRLESLAKAPRRYVIAFSGGLDSTVLLHALAASREIHSKALVALHVDHGLQPDSSGWADRCETLAARLGVETRSVSVNVSRKCGSGPEAAAREARYAVFREQLERGDWLLSAHHADDQAETLLLNLLRGSGPAGIAAIPRLRRLAKGFIARPLIDVPRSALADYAAAQDLEWVDDPSNDDPEYDRNYLRTAVMPLLRDRWPGSVSRLGKSAALAREASGLLNDLADMDLERLGDRFDRLDLTELQRLTLARQKNALRRAVNRAGLPPVPSNALQSILANLMPARPDARPMVQWRGAEARRFRNRLYLLATKPAFDFAGERLGPKPVDLGVGMGSLRIAQRNGPGLARDLVEAGLTLRVRAGGERIKPVGQVHTRELKKLLQEEKVVPWMRERVPLVYCDARLVAVGDLWMDAAAAVPDGWALEWSDRPAIH